MRNVFILLLFLISGSAFAQSDVIINTVTLCIAEGRYNDAEKYLDSLLKDNPNSIDAMMMKGNVLLNYALMQTPAQNTITLDDESIYSPDLASLKTPVVVIPGALVPKIEKLWKHCIELDSGRLDIREGLCTLYGMANRRKELIDYLPVIAKAGKEKGSGFVYALVQYAQLLSERGDKEGAYEAYKKIAALYPHTSSVWCLLASAYRSNGDLVNAKIYADKAFVIAAASSADMAACGDALDIYSVLGDYATALVNMNIAGRDTTFHGYTFYRGIYKYAHHDSTWKAKMVEFVREYSATPDSDVLYNAATFMIAPWFKDDYNDFKRLLTYSNSDFYSGLILEKAISEHKDSIMPYLMEAQLLVNGHNYTKANKLYATVEKMTMNADLRNEYLLQYAFSLYCAGEYGKAQSKWGELSNEQDPIFVAMSNYFLGNCALRMGRKDTARKYFQTVIESKDQTKYAYLSKLQLEKLSGKK